MPNDKPQPRVLRLDLSYKLPTLNVLLRKHYAERGRDKKMIGAQIAVAVCGSRPPEPFERAHVHIIRYSTSPEGPDEDGLKGGCKDIIDCLTTPHLSKPNRKTGLCKTINPYGMALIRDDNPKRTRITVEHQYVSPKEAFVKGCTVIITEVL